MPGLDLRLTALLGDLIGSERWSEAAFSDLVQRHGLMPAGALEAIIALYKDRVSTLNELADAVDTLIMACKPYQIESVIAGLGNRLAGKWWGSIGSPIAKFHMDN